ncbi:MAG: transposase, partial [Actinobacteria bacterium]
LRARQDKLSAAQRALAACAKTGRREGGRRNRAKARVARLHAKMRQARRDVAHRLSARLVRDFDLIAYEALDVAAMTRSARGTIEHPGRNVAQKGGLNRSILDAGWGQLLCLIAYKAASAGRMIQRVPAAHTSQTCAHCGHTSTENRVTRDNFGCVACGHQAHADANAAAVILAVALGRLAIRASSRKRAGNRWPEPGHQPVTAGRDAATSCGS